jgi:hypothetical protein
MLDLKLHQTNHVNKTDPEGDPPYGAGVGSMLHESVIGRVATWNRRAVLLL